METSLSSTSPILRAETTARGMRINTMETTMKDMIMCMEYCIKAIILATSPTLWAEMAAIQTIARERPFMIQVIKGIISTMMRLTNRLVPVRRLLT